MKLGPEGRARACELEELDHEDLAWKAAGMEEALEQVRTKLLFGPIESSDRETLLSLIGQAIR